MIHRILIDRLKYLEIIFWKKLITLMGKRWFLRVAVSVFLVIILSLVVLTSLFTYEVVWSRRNDAQTATDLFLTHSGGEAIHQNNTLIIVVDQLTTSKLLYKPELEGVWLVASTSKAPRLIFLPLYPNSLQGGLQADLNMASQFSLTWNNRPADDFFDYLFSLDIHWDNYILMDDTALLNLAGLAGGVFVDDYGLVDDLDLIEQLILSIPQPQSHAILADSICGRSWELFQRSDPNLVIKRLSGHFYSDLDWRYLVIGWMNMQNYSASFTCEFPTISFGAARPSYLSKGGE